MGFLDSVRRGILLIRLNGKAAAEIAKDKSSMVYGSIIIGVAGLLYATAFHIRTVPFNVKDFLTEFITYVLFTIIGIFIFHGLAKVFGGKSSLKDYFKAQSHVSLLGWLSIFMLVQIPFFPNVLDFLIMVWSTVMSVIILKALHKLSTGKAIVVAIALPVLLILLVIIGALAYFGILSPDKFLPVS